MRYNGWAKSLEKCAWAKKNLGISNYIVDCKQKKHVYGLGNDHEAPSNTANRSRNNCISHTTTSHGRLSKAINSKSALQETN